ncbi:MAG: flagellar filament capping protein FliD [Planctomycetes bacterium]|nr:flagellar filament capping protein FliD [Planctomycetota bacterium]
MSSNISFSGLASGLNTTALVQNLLRFNQQRINLLNQTVQKDTQQQTAFQGIQTRLQTLMTAANQLAQPQGSVFDNKSVTSSNTDLVTAAVGTGAQAGVTSLKVLALAQSNQLASQGFADPSAKITQGDFQIQAGSQSATLNIDSSNNTLSGLATAINNAGIGVTATIVNTGSTDPRTQPYRLMLTSNSTGVANSIRITNNLAASSGTDVQPNFATSEIGPAVTDPAFSGTSVVTSNAGAGGYTGSSNDTFTFSVTNGGTVGTDAGIQLAYSNSSGTQTGTITVNPSDVNSNLTVVDGVTVQFAAGSLTTGDKFSVGVFSPLVQAATDAQVQIGSGSGAVTISNSSNTVTNLVPGVSIKLQAADPAKTVQINVANDVSGIADQIKNFVNDYNDFASYIDTQTKYTPGTGNAAGTAGPLNTVSSVRGLRSQVEQLLLAISPDLPSQVNRLGALGISPDANGQLQIDSTQLNNVLNGNVAGVSFNSVKTLFGLSGTSSSTGVQFATADSTTRSSATPYTVHITQAAQQASISGSNPIAASTVIDSTNNTLVLTVDGKPSSTITLASGTYTSQGLANELQTEINAAVQPGGSSVSVSLDAGKLVITSGRYGTASTVSVNSGNALSALGYSGTESSTGTDVAGSFVVNGVTEAATGTGQILSGNTGNSNTAGLSIVVSLTPSQIAVGGTDSTMTVTRGLAANLYDQLNSMLDPVSGQITLIGAQFTKQIQSAQNDVTTQTTAMNLQQAALMRQFASMETVMANLQSQSNLLTQAFGSGSSTSSNVSLSGK